MQGEPLTNSKPAVQAIKLVLATVSYFVALKVLYFTMMIGAMLLWGSVFGVYSKAGNGFVSILLLFGLCSLICTGATLLGAFLAQKKSLFVFPIALILTAFVPLSIIEIFERISADGGSI